ncbi:MAG TPA: septation protein IspZ [Allosphingosinicella sp.]|jgi:intracellular septation protein
MSEAAAPKKPKPHGLLTFLLDFGPLLLFFVSYKIASGRIGPLSATVFGTLVFMVAIAVAVIVSKVKLGRVSPMMWISAILVIGFGGLTVWFHDPRFIQVKPTIIYTGFAALLLGGLFFDRPLLKHVFGPVFEGLSEQGWMKLSRNWGLFFAFMAVLNEAIRASFSFDTWLTLKVWGATLLSLVFAFANVPMLLRHGFSPEGAEEPPVPPPSL